MWRADDVALVDRAADQGTGAGADDRAESLRSAGSDDVAEHGTADTANDQAADRTYNQDRGIRLGDDRIR